MNILLIGNTGQLGWELERVAAKLGRVTGVDYPDLDLTQPDSITTWIAQSEPDLILNAAAYTAVDRAEEEPGLAKAVNETAPGVLAEQMLARRGILIHYSTDYVFNGEKGTPYREIDPALPINTYGRTKLGGEQAVQQVGGEVYIFRTSWLYSTRRDCFVQKVLNWSRTRDHLNIVEDQVGSPTWARTLAQATVEAIQVMLDRGPDWRKSAAGIYHTAGLGAVSRFEWAQKILELDPHPEEQVLTRLGRARSAEFNTPAQRPHYSALDCSKFQTTFDAFYTRWDEALARALSGSDGMIDS